MLYINNKKIEKEDLLWRKLHFKHNPERSFKCVRMLKDFSLIIVIGGVSNITQHEAGVWLIDTGMLLMVLNNESLERDFYVGKLVKLDLNAEN